LSASRDNRNADIDVSEANRELVSDPPDEVAEKKDRIKTNVAIDSRAWLTPRRCACCTNDEMPLETESAARMSLLITAWCNGRRRIGMSATGRLFSSSDTTSADDYSCHKMPMDLFIIQRYFR